MQLFSACGRRLWPVLALAVVSTLLLPACSKESPDELIASARTYEAKGEHKAAIIQLRNALQQKPADGEARLLLGRASLNVGDPVERAEGVAQGARIRATGGRRFAAACARDARTGGSGQACCRIWRPQAHRTGRRGRPQSNRRPSPTSAWQVERRGSIVQRGSGAEARLSTGPTWPRAAAGSRQQDR